MGFTTQQLGSSTDIQFLRKVAPQTSSGRAYHRFTDKLWPDGSQILRYKFPCKFERWRSWLWASRRNNSGRQLTSSSSEKRPRNLQAAALITASLINFDPMVLKFYATNSPANLSVGDPEHGLHEATTWVGN